LKSGPENALAASDRPGDIHSSASAPCGTAGRSARAIVRQAILRQSILRQAILRHARNHLTKFGPRHDAREPLASEAKYPDSSR
jgi:hypothetical protein